MVFDMVKTAVKALDDKKAEDIRVIKIDDITSLTDYFVICTGTSTTHIKALADECEYRLEQAGHTLLHREGRESGEWILLDYKDIIVHVYNQQLREFYGLEHFWKDGMQIDISEVLGDEK